jgi:hypothetical protein
MKPLSGEQLRKLVREPRDEFGIVHQDILFSEKDNKALCILDAPNKEAVEKHHAKAGLKCDWIYEIETASK